MPRHEFGTIKDFDKDKDYSEYKPDDFNCISVDDELVLGFMKYLKNLKTYHHSFNKKSTGFAYNGVTIIPPQSLMLFYDIVTTSNRFRKSDELANLGSLILSAKKDNKYLIHYGI